MTRNFVDRLSSDELLVRRIKPPPHDMCVIDEATQEVTLNKQALIMQADGISVYQSTLLSTNSLGPWDTVEVDEWPATLQVSVVREQELDAQADPWPDGRAGAPLRDVAHALITNPNGLGRKARDRALSRIARTATLFRPGA